MLLYLVSFIYLWKQQQMKRRLQIHIFSLCSCLSTFLLLLKKYATHNNDILHIWLPSYNEDVYLVNYFSSYLDFG